MINKKNYIEEIKKTLIGNMHVYMEKIE